METWEGMGYFTILIGALEILMPQNFPFEKSFIFDKKRKSKYIWILNVCLLEIVLRGKKKQPIIENGLLTSWQPRLLMNQYEP